VYGDEGRVACLSELHSALVGPSLSRAASLDGGVGDDETGEKSSLLTGQGSEARLARRISSDGRQLQSVVWSSGTSAVASDDADTASVSDRKSSEGAVERLYKAQGVCSSGAQASTSRYEHAQEGENQLSAPSGNQGGEAALEAALHRDLRALKSLAASLRGGTGTSTGTCLGGGGIGGSASSSRAPTERSSSQARRASEASHQEASNSEAAARPGVAVTAAGAEPLDTVDRLVAELQLLSASLPAPTFGAWAWSNREAKAGARAGAARNLVECEGKLAGAASCAHAGLAAHGDPDRAAEEAAACGDPTGAAVGCRSSRGARSCSREGLGDEHRGFALPLALTPADAVRQTEDHRMCGTAAAGGPCKLVTLPEGDEEQDGRSGTLRSDIGVKAPPVTNASVALTASHEGDPPASDCQGVTRAAQAVEPNRDDVGLQQLREPTATAARSSRERLQQQLRVVRQSLTATINLGFRHGHFRPLSIAILVS
jgi:hypothetical protein